MRFFLVFLLFICATLSAQETEQFNKFENDSSIVVQERDTTHSPKKAALYSLIPGGGQIYNHLAMPKGKKKAFWKVPIIYAGLGATGFFAIQNHITQRNLKAEYLFRSEFDTPNLQEYSQYDDQGILTLFEDTRRSRDLMIFAFIAVFGLNVLDAHVEAHFVNFDISKDLSLNLKPRMHDFKTPGLSLSLNFR
ncbi:DUF5683 domain-containing protein [Brumimicrobium mesophilum]|uniref:DUF5683 domain-containing protein n=1 Tax=Brumimicrobium mesophilum TaxID=392717 RepID=UPI000D1404DC|nr:DUF5683 domain-containing protein [Brumimicrobium mesophilum]